MTAAAKTDALVRGLFFAFVGWLAVDRLVWPLAVGALLLLAWEIWALTNSEPHDTISEAIWRLCDQYSLFPWALGAITAWPIASGTLTDPVVIGVLLLLNGHFVFPRYGRQGILCRMARDDPLRIRLTPRPWHPYLLRKGGCSELPSRSRPGKRHGSSGATIQSSWSWPLFSRGRRCDSGRT